jgi:hypothetical protein
MSEKELIRLLQHYGSTLFIPCPSSEQLVLFVKDWRLLDKPELRAIQDHLAVCLDCQDKVKWLDITDEN